MRLWPKRTDHRQKLGMGDNAVSEALATQLSADNAADGFRKVADVINDIPIIFRKVERNDEISIPSFLKGTKDMAHDNPSMASLGNVLDDVVPAPRPNPSVSASDPSERHTTIIAQMVEALDEREKGLVENITNLEAELKDVRLTRDAYVSGLAVLNKGADKAVEQAKSEPENNS